MHDATFEKRIMYLLVDAAGDGAIPIPIKIGLNIEPPPNPRAPETQPPKKARISNLTNVHPTGTMSLLQRPLLYLSLR